MHGSMTRFLGLALVLAFVLSPLAVQAAQSSYQGNYSYDANNSATQGNIVVCDTEADGNPAYALVDTQASGTGFRQDDDSSSGCGFRGFASRVTAHQTCEDEAFRPDPCGPKVLATTR